MHGLVQSPAVFENIGGKKPYQWFDRLTNHVMGAVHAISKRVTTHINTTYVNSQVIIDFMMQLKMQYVDLPIVLVMDNARYQHGW
jgi:transposase